MAILLLSYLSGSIPFGQIVAKRRGIDIQGEGSGNIGATNVARVLGKKLGAGVLLLDALKGAAPVAAATWLVSAGRVPSWTVAGAALAAVLGHCFPVWLRFRGGKGVATALGVFLVVDPVASAVSVAVFAAVYALSRVAALGSLVAAGVFPVVLYLRGRPWVDVGLAAALALVILVRHRDNLARLRQGGDYRV